MRSAHRLFTIGEIAMHSVVSLTGMISPFRTSCKHSPTSPPATHRTALEMSVLYVCFLSELNLVHWDSCQLDSHEDREVIEHQRIHKDLNCLNNDHLWDFWCERGKVCFPAFVVDNLGGVQCLLRAF